MTTYRIKATREDGSIGVLCIDGDGDQRFSDEKNPPMPHERIYETQDDRDATDVAADCRAFAEDMGIFSIEVIAC